MNNDSYIQCLIDEAIEILSPMKVYYTTKAGNNTRALIEVIKKLYPLIKNEIREVLGNVTFYDGSIGVSKQLSNIINDNSV